MSAPGARGVAAALAAYAAFVAYGSLVPLDYQPLPWADALRRFADTPWLALGADSRADWIANGVLYLPLGLLAALWLGPAPGRWSLPRALAWPLAVGGCAVLALGIEFAQLYFPPRTVSLNDLVAEGLGAALGAVLASPARRAAAAVMAAWRADGGRALRALLAVYALAWLLLGFFPYDLLLSTAEWRDKLRGGGWGWWLAASERGALLRLLQLGAEAALCLPLGGWLAHRRAGMRLGTALAAGAALGLLVELGQFFIVSGVSQGASVLTRALGVAAGVVLARQVAAGAWLRWRPRLAAVAPLALLAYLPLLLLANGWGRGALQGPAEAAAVLARVNWLPFYYHYFSTEAVALYSLGGVALMYGLLALPAWLRGWRPAALAIAVALLAAVVEAGKLAFAGLHPDPSNVWIAAGAAAALLALLRALAVRPPAAAPAPAAAFPVAEALRRPPPSPAALGPARPRSPLAMPAAGAALLVALAIALLHPVGGPALAAAVVLVAWLCARWPALALALPLAALPTLDLGPWSGRTLLDEIDALLLACAAGFAWRRRGGAPAVAPPPGRAPLATLAGVAIALALAAGVVRALWPWPGWAALWPLHDFSALHALRIAKGGLWAALLLCMWRQLPASRGWQGLQSGMQLGLAGGVGWVLWERAAFVGLFDFGSEHRVTGPLAAMAKGGAFIECLLAMAAAWPLALLLQRRAALPVRAAAGALLLLAGYAVAVTYSRNGWAALAAVLLVGLLVLPGRGWHARAMLGLAALGAGLAAVLALAGGFAGERLAQTLHDLGVRQAHWADAAVLRRDDMASQLLGEGLGRFPERHYWASRETVRAADIRPQPPVLRLGAGAPAYVEQLVVLDRAEAWTLRARWRTPDGPQRLALSLCRKWTLTSAACEHVAADAGPGGEHQAWRDSEWRLPLAGLRAGMPAPPVKLSIAAPTAGPAIELASVSLRDGGGAERLVNGDFGRGLDRWLVATDVDPPWHIHNAPLAVWFELGWFGVAAWVLLLAVVAQGAAAAWRLARAARGEPPIPQQAALVAALSLVALGVSAMLNTLVDEPRVLALALLMAGLAARGGAVQPAAPAGRGVAGPAPGPAAVGP